MWFLRERGVVRVVVAITTFLGVLSGLSADAKAQSTPFPTKWGTGDVSRLPNGDLEWKWRGGETVVLQCVSNSFVVTCPDGSTHNVKVEICRGSMAGTSTGSTMGLYAQLVIVNITGCPGAVQFQPTTKKGSYKVKRGDEEFGGEDRKSPLWDGPVSPANPKNPNSKPTAGPNAGRPFEAGQAYWDVPGLAEFKEVSQDPKSPGGKVGDQVSAGAEYTILVACICLDAAGRPVGGQSFWTGFTQQITLTVGTSAGAPPGGTFPPGSTSGGIISTPLEDSTPRVRTEAERAEPGQAMKNLPITSTSELNRHRARAEAGKKFKEDKGKGNNR